MTRKHFKHAATIIAKEKNDKTRFRMAQVFIEVAKDANPNFDVYKFLTACRLKGGTDD